MITLLTYLSRYDSLDEVPKDVLHRFMGYDQATASQGTQVSCNNKLQPACVEGGGTRAVYGIAGLVVGEGGYSCEQCRVRLVITSITVYHAISYNSIRCISMTQIIPTIHKRTTRVCRRPLLELNPRPYP